jgi:hypothetical protein
MKLRRFGDLLGPLIVAVLALLLFVLPDIKPTDWRKVYQEMSVLDESTIEKGFGILFSEMHGGYYLNRSPIDPRPILQQMKAAGFHWNGTAFKDDFGTEYSRLQVLERLYPRNTHSNSSWPW